MKIRSYSELRRLPTFEARFRYLDLRGQVGEATFGFDRWMGQAFYHSRQWMSIRSVVIARDYGCDLGVAGYEIQGGPLIHHMNPITPEALAHGEEWILDPEYLITTSHRTHNAIHYGDENQLPRPVIERRPGDTKLW
jgi:hypothetical protein